ncbi:MAG: hypothetical protein M3R00_07620, partial [Pseudomonadota bacterium]|nr:hypothetical protein [Pseudomonadota bacterium]
LQPHCENSLYNAYYGLGPHISNGFKLNTIDAMLAHLNQFLQSNNILIDRAQAWEQGVQEAKKIAQDCYATEKSVEPDYKKSKVTL